MHDIRTIHTINHGEGLKAANLKRTEEALAQTEKRIDEVRATLGTTTRGSDLWFERVKVLRELQDLKLDYEMEIHFDIPAKG